MTEMATTSVKANNERTDATASSSMERQTRSMEDYIDTSVTIQQSITVTQSSNYCHTFMHFLLKI